MSSELASRYDPKEAQDRWYKFWEENGYFHAEPPAAGTADSRKPYTIVIPPPNVTGALHMGHALNNTLQDILIRWRRMQGYNTLWMPGTDHAGIATQAVVERRIREQEGKTRRDLGRDELVRRIWEWKDEYEKRILNQLRKLGCSCDWQRTRFTFDEGCSRAVRETFFKMFRDGLIYRGKRLVNWDTQLQTSVADDETYAEEVKSGFWTFKYPVKREGERGTGGEGETEFVRFSTTRPETMLGDTAVAVHPNDPRYKHLIGKLVTIPLVGRQIPIIADGLLVDPELGTGCVKVTPAHDMNDYACGLRHKLPMINILNPDGTINESGGKYAGMDRYKARDAVTADMEALGLFEGREDRMIPLKFSDRSKSPIEPYLSDQWFVKMGDLQSLDRVQSQGIAASGEMATESGSDGLELPQVALELQQFRDESRGFKSESPQFERERGQYGHESRRFEPESSRGGDESSQFKPEQSQGEHELPRFDAASEPYGHEARQDEPGPAPFGRVAGAESAKPRQPGSAAEAGASQTQPQPPGLAELAMEAVRDGRVKIHPERYAKTYLDWLGEKRDWCISRQLWWGHRIPVWTRSKDVAKPSSFWIRLAELNATHEDTMSVKFFEAAEWPNRGAARCFCCLGPNADDIASQLDSLGLEQDPDVLDTWFSAQLWPHSTLGWPERSVARPESAKGVAAGARSESTPFADSGRATLAAMNDPDWNQMKFYYPTSVLVTSRDIITLWVARMVIAGLYNCGDVPFRDVYITPKILDGFGQTMSKSKGNGVDPLDIIDKYGADALRFGIATMTTESQDARLPVGYECPFCQTTIAQKIEHQQMKPKTLKPDPAGVAGVESSSPQSSLDHQSGGSKTRPQPPHCSVIVKPRIKCPSCKKDFQFSSPNFDPDPGEPVARVVSERFEQGRNFANKLWNAARFALMNLEGYSESVVTRSGRAARVTPGIATTQLADEERWILSRLAATVAEVTDHLENFRFSEVAKSLYEFSWSEFCDWYVEMAKLRLKNPATRATAQGVLATVLDYLLRLLHPVMPFVTEQIWQALAELAPQRGLDKPEPAAKSVMIASWPVAPSEWRNPAIEKRMARLQELIKSIRNIRSNFNVDPRSPVAAHVRCSAAVAAELRAASPFIEQLATVNALDVGPHVTKPPDAASAVSTDWELYVPLTGLIDRPAEIERNRKQLESIAAQLKSFQSKLANADFVSKAPPDVVELHRQRVVELQAQKGSIEQILRELGGAA